MIAAVFMSVLLVTVEVSLIETNIYGLLLLLLNTQTVGLGFNYFCCTIKILDYSSGLFWLTFMYG